MTKRVNTVPGVSRREILAGALGVLATQSCQSPTKPHVRMPARPHRNPYIDAFVADCIAASEELDPQAAVAEVLRKGISNPRAMLEAVGEPTEAGITTFHRSKSLTIFSATWTPQMNLMPHNHLMWSLIGIYTGREDNILWRRSDEGITAYGANCLFEGDVVALPETTIHSVTNPLERFTGGIHVYGGDFFATTRSQWDPETREEQPSDGDVIRGIFERANAELRRG